MLLRVSTFVYISPRALILDSVSVGSVQNIADIPDDLKLVFRTAFELDPRVVVDLALDRSPYIDQSQSMNLYVATPTTQILVCALAYFPSTSSFIGFYEARRPALRLETWLENRPVLLEDGAPC